MDSKNNYVEGIESSRKLIHDEGTNNENSGRNIRKKQRL